MVMELLAWQVTKFSRYLRLLKTVGTQGSSSFHTLNSPKSQRLKVSKYLFCFLTVTNSDFEREGKEESIYISLAFSETEHLIALTGMPTYCIQVWYWRTHDMLISEYSELMSDKQKITCSSSLPLTVAQFAHTKGKLVVWEVHGTQKFCKLIKRKIKLDFKKTDGPFQDVYSIEGNIQIVNNRGDIYYVIPSSGSVNLIAKWNGDKGNMKTSIAYVRNGILISGPDGTLKYYKRQKYVWNEIFQTKTSTSFAMLKGYHDNETVIGTTVNGGMYKIVLSDSDKISISEIKNYDVSFEFFALVNPTGDHLVAVDSSNEIRVMCVKTGRKVAEISINNQTILQSNPKYPLIAIGNDFGDVTCVSLFDPERPKILTEFFLSRRSIFNLRFADNGNFLVVLDSDSNFFVIKSIPGEKMVILHHFKETLKIVDFFIVESREKLDILFLCASEYDSTVGNLIVKIVIPFDHDEEIDKEELILPTNYRQIMSISGETKKFYAIRNGVKYIEVLELEEDSVALSNVIETPHQLRHIEGCKDDNHLVTWSIDGIVAVHAVNRNHEVLAAFVAGNRHNYGVKMAHCDANCELIVTLDQLGNMICSKIKFEKSVEAQSLFMEAFEKAQEKIAEMFSLTTSGGFPGLSAEHFGKKFTDLKSEQTYQMEARESEQTRKFLFGKLENLRTQIKKMLDENEKNHEDEKLEVQDFNLDLMTTAEKEQEAKEERDQEEKKMMDFIDAQTTMNNWIVEKCWNPMEVKGIKLRGMFINLFVDNYPLLKEEDSKELAKIKLMRSIENSVARDDAFLPWRPIPTM
jgi:hypothetical protein